MPNPRRRNADLAKSFFIPRGPVCAAGAALLLAGLAGLAPAQPEETAAGAEIHQLDARFEVEDGMRVRLENPHGNVRVRAVPLVADGELRVTVQTPAGRSNPLRIRQERRGRELVLAVEADDPRVLRTPGRLLRADFVVALPDRVELDVEMDAGDFTMHAASYPVRLRAEHATVRLRTSGPVDVELLDGHVIYHLEGRDPVAGGRIQTSAAPVDVIRADLARVRFETLSGAAVTSDSLEILSARETDGRIQRFGDDRDQAVLYIQTDTGPIRLVAHGLR